MTAAVRLLPVLLKLVKSPVGRIILQRLGYGTAGYGVGAVAEKQMSTQGADLTPATKATMRMNPALMYAALGPSAMRWAKQPYVTPAAFGTFGRVWRPLTLGTAATINPMLSYITDPGKQRMKAGLGHMRDTAGTVPNYLKSVSDDTAALTSAYTYGGSSAGAETLKKVLTPTVKSVADTILPPLKAGLDPAIRSVGRALVGGTLGSLGGYALANWLLPTVRNPRPEANMTRQDMDSAYMTRLRKETRRKALAMVLGTAAGGLGAAVADPSSARFWWKSLTNKA